MKNPLINKEVLDTWARSAGNKAALEQCRSVGNAKNVIIQFLRDFGLYTERGAVEEPPVLPLPPVPDKKKKKKKAEKPIMEVRV